MNLKQILNILIGLLIVIIGVIIGIKWKEELIIVIKGVIPLLFGITGLIWILIGYLIFSED
ncbi:TPA: hypothetical protein EYP13_03825 [Candidatus Micrarchaeota archaeon]|nr:hypothetical protein [Candidatus Micrarchaeota archaeon]